MEKKRNYTCETRSRANLVREESQWTAGRLGLILFILGKISFPGVLFLSLLKVKMGIGQARGLNCSYVNGGRDGLNRAGIEKKGDEWSKEGEK